MKITKYYKAFCFVLYAGLFLGCNGASKSNHERIVQSAGQTVSAKRSSANAQHGLLQYAEYEHEARNAIQAFTPEELIGQVLMLYVPGSVPSRHSAELLKSLHPGGVIFFKANVANTPEDVRKFTDFIRDHGTVHGIAPFVAIDHEGGVVYRLKNNAVHLPAPLKYSDPAYDAFAETAGVIAGSELRWLGLTLNLAPVAESNAAQPVLGTRIWSLVPEDAGRRAAIFIDRHQGQSSACTLKHFPGTGVEDPHRSLSVLTDNPEVFYTEYLVSFAHALRAEPAAVLLSLVVAPVIDPHTPVVFSHKVVTEFLKGHLAYRGFVLTDDLYMKALSAYGSIPERCLKALNAGCDMLMLSGQDVRPVIDYLRRALDNGKLDRARLEDAAVRIIIQKLRFKIDKLPDFSLDAYTKLLAEHAALLKLVIEK